MVKFYFILSFLILIICCTNEVASSKYTKSNNLAHKQRGAHVFGFRDSFKPDQFDSLNIEWITIVPYGYQPDHTSAEIQERYTDTIQLRKGNERWIARIEDIRSKGFKVFLKPHIWMRTSTDGKWRSDIYPENDENWEKWKKSYTRFILRYAEIAEKTNTEMFCLGAECTRLTLEKPEYWEELIHEVRKVYKGKLTYAANWYEEYENIRFWNKLDYIGIQAYFPLTDKINPTTKDLSNGWKPYIKDLESFHKRFKMPIIFTELGYKSRLDAAIKPWEWIDYENLNESDYSEKTQMNCYEAFFEEVWQKEWFHGVHLWQFRNDYTPRENGVNLDFYPQGKGTEHLIRKGFE